LVPEACGDGEAIDGNENFPDFAIISREARGCPDKVTAAGEATFEESFANIRGAKRHLQLGDSGTDEFESIRAGNRAVCVIRGGIRAAIRDEASPAACRFGVIDPLRFDNIIHGLVGWQVIHLEAFDEGVLIGERGNFFHFLGLPHIREFGTFRGSMGKTVGPRNFDAIFDMVWFEMALEDAGKVAFGYLRRAFSEM
jgi:hypothetical protein